MEAQIGSRRKSQELKHGNATRICAKTGPSYISSPELRYRFRNRLPRVWWVSKASFKIESFFLMAFAEKHPFLTQVFLSCVLSPCEKPMKKWSFSPWALLWTLPLRSQPRFVSTGWHIETGAWTCWIEYRSTNKLRLGSFGKVPSKENHKFGRFDHTSTLPKHSSFDFRKCRRVNHLKPSHKYNDMCYYDTLNPACMHILTQFKYVKMGLKSHGQLVHIC